MREEVRRGERVPVPCRLTVLSARGALATTGATSTDRLAVRPGVIYTADGTAKFGLPAGEYTIHAGRGFEYGTETVRVSLKPGENVRKEFVIRREVATPGFVACDTHVHTLTHSGHGDSTDIERAITAAGEGLELVVATDHNIQVDYHAAAVKAGVRKYFTPVVGNEVTTGVGHFNVFPLAVGAPVPNFKVKDWKGLTAALDEAKAPRVVILNHARDLHAKFRPFGPERHVALTGEDLDGWTRPRLAHDVHLVAVTSGPGVDGLFWPIGKPYQAASPVVRKRVIGLTGAVWLDGDGDDKRSSAHDYAEKVVPAAGTDWRKAVKALAAYDEATAAQAAGLLRAAGVSLSDKDVRAAAKAAGEQVLRGFDAYAEAWRASQIARQEAKP